MLAHARDREREEDIPTKQKPKSRVPRENLDWTGAKQRMLLTCED